MKKIFLLTFLLFQLTLVFGQTPIAEDEKVIQYNTKWGAWVSAPNNNNILFSAKLNLYDKEKKLYSWSVRKKLLKMPIAFEWKISNQVFTDAADHNDAVEENDGYYTSSIYDNKDNSNSMNSSGFEIFSTSKTTLYYQVRNVCYEFEGREPNCEIKTKKSDIQNTNKKNLNLNTLDLENTVINNIKLFLNDYTHIIYNEYIDKLQNVSIQNNELLITIHQQGSFGGYSCPYHNTTLRYSFPIFSIVLEKYLEKSYSKELLVLRIKSDQQLMRNRLYQIIKQDECKIVSNDESNITAPYFDFEYNFGPNDKNFIELKNAIEALKNPNKSYGSSSKQSGNAQKTVVVKEKEIVSKKESISTNSNVHTYGKELIKYLGKIDNGQTYIHSFRLSKRIKSALASCGCITVETNIDVPTVVIASFHGIANYKGPFVKNITVTYEDGTSETLTFKGELK